VQGQDLVAWVATFHRRLVCHCCCERCACCMCVTCVSVHLGWTKHSFSGHFVLLTCPSMSAGLFQGSRPGSDPDAAMQRSGNPPLHCTARVFAQGQGLARLLNSQLLVPWLSHTAGMHGFPKGFVCVGGSTGPLYVVGWLDGRKCDSTCCLWRWACWLSVLEVVRQPRA
jgi:hypothetical protein